MAPLPLLVSIVGPTAVGKTSLSIELAQHFSCEILSADSRQMYQEIAIGTAKPSTEEMQGVPHHFLDFLPLEQAYSAGQFERDGLALIEELGKKNSVVILSGGSGLYVQALLQGLDEIPKDISIRKELIRRLETEELDVLVEELKAKDPLSFEKIDIQNPQRVVRALEVCLCSGRPFSSFHRRRNVVRPFHSLLIGLRREREELNRRIAQRTELMMQNGWEEEAQMVSNRQGLNSLNTVGYKELFAYFRGETSKGECQEQIIRSTQRYAKRQMTWFKRMEGIEWLDLPDEKVVDKLIEKIEGRLKSLV